MYKIKRLADDNIERYRVQLIARDFTQQEGIDYSETFIPVIKQATVMLVFNIHNVFLNGVIIEDVCMKQLPSFVDFTLSSHVCQLYKSLYGLKQAPRAWYTYLSDYLLSLGFHAFKVDTSLFILSVSADIFYLLVYIDDILLIGSDSTILQCLIQLLSSEFKLRDLGDVHYFLGIEVQSTGMGLMLRQHKYILDILTRAGMTSCKSVDTPISTFKVTVLPDSLFFYPTRFHQTPTLLLTESVILCMLLQILIGLSLNAFYVIFRVRSSMTYISLVVTSLLYMALRMQIEQVVLMIALWVVTLFTLIIHRFRGNQASNAWLSTPLPGLNTKP